MPHSGPEHDAIPFARHHAKRTRAGVGVDDELGAGGESIGDDKPCADAANAVAGHLGPAAVSVVQRHVRAGDAAFHDDETVRADALVPVANRASEGSPIDATWKWS